MGKRKRSRSRDDDYDSILRKVKKLEQRLKNRRRSSSRSPSIEQENIDVNIDVHQSETQSPLRDMEFTEADNNDNVNEACLNNKSVDNAEQTTNVEPELDPNILSILGDDPQNENTFGEKLHKDVSTRWQHLLINGLQKEVKSEIIKLYPVPENCSSLKAPKLNLEIKAALTEMNLKKDNFSENKQNQLSSGIAALGKALTVAFSSNPSSQDLIKYLSDAGRLLCDYHYRESQSRRYSIINTLNKQTRDTIRDTKLDEYLFGSDLADHLKSSKAIEKSGLELKPVYTPRVQSKVDPAVQHQRGALNSRGASRTAASETRPYAAARRSPDIAPTTRDRRHEPSTSRSSYYHRQRGRRR
ncbi:uncharacterized protein LOC134805721 [Cydia splendana]|uniref:uncharacterized protein LOC134805721 n=1 Tax=Cydia splendana TaxID=1100963 RepID=UPI00300D95A9